MHEEFRVRNTHGYMSGIRKAGPQWPAFLPIDGTQLQAITSLLKMKQILWFDLYSLTICIC